MLNVIVLMGCLVADPELRNTPNGVAVTSFRIAVDRSYAKSNADRQTDFIDITTWRGTAEFVCRYFTKGSMIAVQGSLRNNNYTDRDGIKQYRCTVLADSVSFCGGKRESGANNRYDNGGGSSSYQQGSSVPEPTYSSGGDDFNMPDDDDLPF